MVEPVGSAAPPVAAEVPPADPGEGGAVGSAGRPPLFSRFQVVALCVALAFLAGALGYLVGHRSGDADPLSSTDVGFMRDMGYHHDQAVQMSVILLGKPSVDPDLGSYAMEILLDQRMEMGIYNATLDRFGHPTDPGKTAMGWMGGPAVPLDSMAGLASPAQIAELTKATGKAAAALWIALMCEHHLGGMHMADYEARHGHDRTTVNLAQADVKTQRGEVIDLQRYRTMHHLPIPKGFTDPLQDQRLNPISLAND